MANPTRETTAGRIYNDLRNLARRTSRSTDEGGAARGGRAPLADQQQFAERAVERREK